MRYSFSMRGRASDMWVGLWYLGFGPIPLFVKFKSKQNTEIAITNHKQAQGNWIEGRNKLDCVYNATICLS